ncbi:nitronate monooxygenase [Microbulbifer taiwanensis]|uniref:NAD(P)H-dependent flavin oxidoreductase n=1 Tax=Microbulbifer taiwanensis TaxID=986746 RepID=A0ABW1YRY4_9GAMM|nr:nitronate monooxygenase [Microbulbifer taiwanensis]
MRQLQTPLTELLGCRYPVIQTAMGWVADARLVAASGNAGAFGFLAGAVMSAEEVEQGIRQIKAASDRPFGVNFHMYTPAAADIVDICIREGVRAVSYSRSPAKKLVEKLKSAGIVCIPTVGALKHAVKAVQMGADAVVVQGGEGGGHTGSVAGNILLPQVVDALIGELKVPVVAAGGFKDGRGLVAALSYGAAGIAMGTRFLMTKESPVPDATKAQYLGASAEKIVVSRKLDGLPQRMIENPCLQQLQKSSALGLLWLAVKNGLAYTRQSGESLPAMLGAAWKMKKSNGLSLGQTMMAANAPMMIQQAMVKGHPDSGILPSGQVAGAILDLPNVAELIQSIAAEAEVSLARLEKLSKNHKREEAGAI